MMKKRRWLIFPCFLFFWILFCSCGENRIPQEQAAKMIKAEILAATEADKECNPDKIMKHARKLLEFADKIKSPTMRRDVEYSGFKYKALSHKYAGDLLMALDALSNALKAAPDHSLKKMEILHEMGMIYYMQNDLKRMHGVIVQLKMMFWKYEKALRNDGTAAIMILNDKSMIISLEEKYFEKTKQVFEREKLLLGYIEEYGGIEIFAAENAFSHFFFNLLAAHYKNMKQMDKSRYYAEKTRILCLSRTNLIKLPDSFYILAELSEEEKNLNEAEKYCREFIRLKEDSLSQELIDNAEYYAYARLAHIYRIQGKYDKMLEVARTAEKKANTPEKRAFIKQYFEFYKQKENNPANHSSLQLL